MLCIWKPVVAGACVGVNGFCFCECQESILIFAECQLILVIAMLLGSELLFSVPGWWCGELLVFELDVG
jgi:hypothetical protein